MNEVLRIPSNFKPILLNPPMVKAILDGRKTVTRRLVKFKPGQNPNWTGYIPDGPVLYGGNNIPAVKAPYRPRDILYVREAAFKDVYRYMYQANYTNDEKFYRAGKEVHIPWIPSSRMPKEAARIFLRVTDVRAERLKEITFSQTMAEGIRMAWYSNPPGWGFTADFNSAIRHDNYKGAFAHFWDGTIKPADRGKYGWDANPWVWAITFEKISKEKVIQADKYIQDFEKEDTE